MQQRAKKMVGVAAITAVLAIAAFLRVNRLASAPPGLYHDEAMNGNDCLTNIEFRRVSAFYPSNMGREGMYINIATISVFLFGNTAWALRLPAALFGVLTVLGVYLVGMELFSRSIGLFASFLVATSFWHIVLSRIALRAVAAPFFFCIALYLLLMGLRRTRLGAGSTATMLAAGIFYGLGFHTYIAYRATPILVGVIWALSFRGLRKHNRGGAFWRALLAFGTAATLAVTPLLVYFASHGNAFAGRMSQISVLHSHHPLWEIVLNIWRTGRMLFVRGDSNWRQNYAYQAELFWPVAILFTVGAVVSLSARWRGSNRDARDRFPYLVVLAWMIIGAAPAVLSDELLPHALRSILLVPPVFIVAAIGAREIVDRAVLHLPMAALAPLAAGLVVALIYQPYHLYFDVWSQRAEVAHAMESDAVAIAERVNALPRTVPKYIAIDGREAYQDDLPVKAATIQYLTASHTKKQQQLTNIRYFAPETIHTSPGKDLCSAVAATLPVGGVVFCLKYGSGV